jgi:hypothetical protein
MACESRRKFKSEVDHILLPVGSAKFPFRSANLKEAVEGACSAGICSPLKAQKARVQAAPRGEIPASSTTRTPARRGLYAQGFLERGGFCR